MANCKPTKKKDEKKHRLKSDPDKVRGSVLAAGLW
jgi:hypothetical protein